MFFFLMIRRPPRSTRTDTLFPYTTLFRSVRLSDRTEAQTGALVERADRRSRRSGKPGPHRNRAPGRPSGFLCDHDGALAAASEGREEQRYHLRSEESRVGKECVSTWRYRVSPYN